MGVRLPLLPPLEAWPSGKAARCYRAERLPAAPQVRILLPPSKRPSRAPVGAGGGLNPAHSAALRAATTRDSSPSASLASCGGRTCSLFRCGRVGKTRDCYSRGTGSSPVAGAFGGRCPWSHGSLITSRAWFDSRTSDSRHLQSPPMPALPASTAAAGRNIATDRSRHGSAPPSRTSIGFAPVVERHDAGLSIRKRGFDSRRGFCMKETSRRRVARGSDGTTAARSVGRNVHPASLRGEGISLAAAAAAGRCADVQRMAPGSHRAQRRLRPRLREASPPPVLPSGCRGVGHPAGFGRRRSQVRLLPARSSRVLDPTVSPLVADARKPSATSRAS